MRALSISDSPGGILRVLAIGAHADDIEIGCGATLLGLTRSQPEVHVTWVVFCATGDRREEARSSASTFLGSAAQVHVEVHDFRDGFLPYVGAEVKEVFEDLKARVQPDLILTHTSDDLHQDHRLVCELTWNTWRDHLILEYEIPKYDGDLGRPNLLCPVPVETAHEKVRLLLEQFPSQAEKDWFDESVFLGLMRLRGMEARASSGYAEGFVCRKLVLALP
jgi:LmbE family N-acetylglucosaminyl deacetylase